MFRAKLTKLDIGVVVANPSPRVRILYDNRNHATQKVILYVGFPDKESAERLYSWLITNGYRHYDHATDTGILKPRKAERVDGMAWEIKIHRPTVELVERFIAKDLAR